jgi:hypothetical protein
MSALWWLALALLVLPVWWHRRRRRQFTAQPLASARFLPQAEPRRLRAWRWRERVLLLVRCLLLACTVAWLADLVLPWRGDAVLVAAGTDPAWAEREAAQAGFAQATVMTLPTRDAFGWLLRHEREWQRDARLLLVGDIPMPALRPRLSHPVEVRARALPQPAAERHVFVAGPRAAEWNRLFKALDGPHRYRLDAQPGQRSELIVWDLPGAPPAGLHAPLWWATDARAFPELGRARQADGPRGRIWLVDGPPRDADAARALFEAWQELHYGAPPYSTPSQRIEAAGGGAPSAVDGALRYMLTLLLLALFGAERYLAHAGGR